MLDTLAAVLALLGGAIWAGGYVTIFVVNRVARRTLQPAERVAFFRGLGRTFGVTSTIALAVAFAFGGVLLRDHAWDGTLTATVAVAAALSIATGCGVVQARSLSRARRAALAHGEMPPSLEARIRRAAVLRGVMGALTLALVVLAAVLAT